jgi:uncharacterized protein (UPF0147 family)
MKVSTLLELHNKNLAEHCLPKNLGDGFLFAKNRIFRNIRRATIQIKYKFSDNPSSAFQAFPFSQLEEILKDKIIPYVNHVSILEKIVERLQGNLNWDEVIDGFKRNYIFHESCHAVARSHFGNLNANQDKNTDEFKRKKCLQVLLEESFANTCELLAVVDANDQAHKIFYEINSYSAVYESRAFFKSAFDKYGDKFVFKFILICYLYSNFLHQNLKKNEFDQILKIFEKDEAKNCKNLQALSKIPFTLDVRFRTLTTGLHLRLSGLGREGQDLLDFDFIKILFENEEYMKMIDSITERALA